LESRLASLMLSIDRLALSNDRIILSIELEQDIVPRRIQAAQASRAPACALIPALLTLSVQLALRC
jgi:hypothetical protein